MRSLVVLLFGCSVLAQAQPGDSLRSAYIQEYPNHFFVWPVLKGRSLSFVVRDVDQKKNEVSFLPNSTVSMGVGFYVLEVGFEITFAVPLAEHQRKIFGKTDARDLQLNVLTKSWGLDVYTQKYSGFYKEDSRVKIPAGVVYPLRPDVDMRNFGLSGFYVLNNRKFSLRSSYNFAERQLKRKGSVIFYGTLNSFRLSADSVLLSESEQNGFGSTADIQNLRYTTISLAPGYSYNLVWKKFFFNGTLTLGPAHHWITYKPEGESVKYDINLNATYSVRLAIGYNSDRFFGGLGLVTQSRVVRIEDVEFENASNTVRILLGYRFVEKGLLQKRVWDFLPFLKG